MVGNEHDQMKVDEGYGMLHAGGRREMDRALFWWGNLKEGDHFKV
jgi:hypothetical protein